MDAEQGTGNRFVEHIPSYSEVLEHDRPRPPPNFFRPSSSSQQDGIQRSSDLPAAQPSAATGSSSQGVQTSAAGGQPNSFTEAFSFVKDTKFYAAPPVPPLQVPATPPVQWGNMGAESVSKPEPASVHQSRNAIVVSKRQQGNPVLKHIRNVRWVFGDVVPDYLLGQYSCALYISLRYHLLHPDYLFFRIRELQKSYRLRVVLCHVDLEDVIKPLHEITKTALLNDCSLICAWSLEECARYLETLKMYENKPADAIQERTDNDYLSKLTSALTTVRHINKTDVVTLGSSFGTLAAVVGGSMEDFARCPGVGERKVKRLYDAFNEPFRRVPKQMRPSDVGTALVTSQEKVSGDASEIGVVKPATSKLLKMPDDSLRDALSAARLKSASKGPADQSLEDAVRLGPESRVKQSVDHGNDVDVCTQRPSRESLQGHDKPVEEKGSPSGAEMGDEDFVSLG